MLPIGGQRVNALEIFFLSMHYMNLQFYTLLSYLLIPNSC